MPQATGVIASNGSALSVHLDIHGQQWTLNTSDLELGHIPDVPATVEYPDEDVLQQRVPFAGLLHANQLEINWVNGVRLTAQLPYSPGDASLEGQGHWQPN